MKSYKYAQLVFPFAMNGGVRLSSTDSQVLDWILAELKKVVTGFRSNTGELPSGEKYLLDIDKLRYKDIQVGWWILKQLGLQGWEPFAARTDNIPEKFCYHLRLEVSAE